MRRRCLNAPGFFVVTHPEDLRPGDLAWAWANWGGSIENLLERTAREFGLGWKYAVAPSSNGGMRLWNGTNPTKDAVLHHEWNRGHEPVLVYNPVSEIPSEWGEEAP